jgi:ribosomal protein S18 acetylase RimI-like enzyme
MEEGRGMIRRAERGDLAEILALQKKAFGPVAVLVGNMGISPMVQTYESIAREYDTSLFLKYVPDGRIIGSVRGYLDDGNRCQVCRLIVDPEYQNRGIGKELMGALEGFFADCDGYALFTGSGGYNEKTISFYRRLGYAVTSEKDHGGVPMVFMDKPNTARLRKAEERDLPGIHSLYQLAAEWLKEQGIRQWDTDVYPTYETARKAWEDGHLFCVGDNPVATMILNDIQPRQYGGINWRHRGRALVIHTLVVHPEHTGQGLGRRILQYAERQAAEGRYDCIRIDVFPGNAAAMNLYQTYGFTYAGEVVFDYKEPGYEVYHCFEMRVAR